MEHAIVRRVSPYARKLMVTAVYDVLDRKGCDDYERDRDSGDIVFQVEVYGNRSRFAVSVEDWMLATRMTVAITDPAPGLSEDGELRAVNCFADEIMQYLENEWRIKEFLQRETDCEAKGRSKKIEA